MPLGLSLSEGLGSARHGEGAERAQTALTCVPRLPTSKRRWTRTATELDQVLLDGVAGAALGPETAPRHHVVFQRSTVWTKSFISAYTWPERGDRAVLGLAASPRLGLFGSRRQALTLLMSHTACSALPNVRAKRATTAGRQGPVGENVPRTADRALVACRWRSA